MLQKFVASCVLTMGLSGMGSASDYHSRAGEFRWVTDYKQVTCMETKRVAYTRVVTKYDHCDRPYRVEEICYRTIQVPVTRTVAYKKWTWVGQ